MAKSTVSARVLAALTALLACCSACGPTNQPGSTIPVRLTAGVGDSVTSTRQAALTTPTESQAAPATETGSDEPISKSGVAVAESNSGSITGSSAHVVSEVQATDLEPGGWIGTMTPQSAPSSMPGAPRLQPTLSDFSDPSSVLQQWLQVWCWRPATGSANANIAAASHWVTQAGFDADRAAGATSDQWAQTVAAGVSTRCGQATATVSMDAPTSKDAVWMIAGAEQFWVTDTGTVVGTQQITRTRLVTRQPDGRWLVDIAAEAG